MYHLKKNFILFYFLLIFFTCHCNLNNDFRVKKYPSNNYSNLKNYSNEKLSRYQLFLSRLRKTTRSDTPSIFSFSGRNKKNLMKQNLIISNSDLNTTNEIPSLSQKTLLAFQHGLRIKKVARCELPKPTVVYINKNHEQVKFYLPRATILHRCGQNTGCCESEAQDCVAVEQQQVNLYFFVIKLENEETESLLDNNIHSIRKSRKLSFVEKNDDSLLKEYEYNFDYNLNNETNLDNKNSSFKQVEDNYINILLENDSFLKEKLFAYNNTSKRKSKSIKLGLLNEKDNFDQEIKTSIKKKNLLNEEENDSSDTFSINKKNNSPIKNFRKSSIGQIKIKTTQNQIRKSFSRRSLGGQNKPKQTIEMLTFTNHTKCACVNKFMNDI